MKEIIVICFLNGLERQDWKREQKIWDVSQILDIILKILGNLKYSNRNGEEGWQEVILYMQNWLDLIINWGKDLVVKCEFIVLILDDWEYDVFRKRNYEVRNKVF